MDKAEARPLQVLLVARLLLDKGLREYAEAADRLAADGRRIDWLVAGDFDPGNPASVDPADFRVWTESGLLRHLGHVDDIANLYRSSDLCVLPSYREGLPRTLIEAGACGLPLVATDVPGCREVVIDGKTGILVPPRDGVALAAAVASLDDAPAKRAAYGASARRHVRSYFADEQVIAATLRVYGELGLSIHVAGDPGFTGGGPSLAAEGAAPVDP